MKKYICVTDRGLYEYLINQDYTPLHNNDDRNRWIFTKSSELEMDVIGWSRVNAVGSVRSKGGYLYHTINNQRELDIELMMWGI